MFFNYYNADAQFNYPYFYPVFRQFPSGMPPFFPPMNQPPRPQNQFNNQNSNPSYGPPGAPPNFIPKKPSETKGIGLKAIDTGAIRPCKFTFVYIWLNNGRSFWAWLTYVGRESVAGFRWTRYGWRYFGIDSDRIDSFLCY